MLDVIRGNIRRRRDLRGGAYPTGWDLRETGKLQGSFRTHAVDAIGGVTNEDPKSAPVNARVAFMGIPDDDIERHIDPAIIAELERLEKSLS